MKWEPSPWLARRVKLDHMNRVVFNPAYAFCKVRPPILYSEESTELLITNVPVVMYKDRTKELDTMPPWALLIQRTAYAQWFSGPLFVASGETSVAQHECVVCTHSRELGADTTECDNEDLFACYHCAKIFHKRCSDRMLHLCGDDADEVAEADKFRCCMCAAASD